MDLKMGVAGVYVAVLRAERDVDLAETTVRSLESHTRDVYLRFRNDQNSSRPICWRPKSCWPMPGMPSSRPRTGWMAAERRTIGIWAGH